MMFITPMPPTSSEMDAIQMSCRFVALDSSCSCFARSKRSSLAYFTSPVSFVKRPFSTAAAFFPASVMASVFLARTTSETGSSYL